MKPEKLFELIKSNQVLENQKKIQILSSRKNQNKTNKKLVFFENMHEYHVHRVHAQTCQKKITTYGIT